MPPNERANVPLREHPRLGWIEGKTAKKGRREREFSLTPGKFFPLPSESSISLTTSDRQTDSQPKKNYEEAPHYICTSIVGRSQRAMGIAAAAAALSRERKRRRWRQAGNELFCSRLQFCELCLSAAAGEARQQWQATVAAAAVLLLCTMRL